MKPSTILIWLLLLCIAVPIFGCGGDDDDDDSAKPQSLDDDDDDSSDEFVDSDYRENPAVALVITTEEMEKAWTSFADWKNRTGLRTDVVLIEDVLGDQAESAFALRDYIRDQVNQGMQYVLLGGDADQIPYIRGYTEVWALEDYYGTAPIQTFYEVLDADWDADSDGNIGEQDDDLTLEQLRQPVVSVGRVPVETEDEALGYIEKLMRYEAAEGKIAQRAACPLFMADVAASVPYLGDIDGGMSHEQLLGDYIPEEFIGNMRRLYGTQYYADFRGAELGTKENVREAIEDEGYTFSVTNTHGSFSTVTLNLRMDTVKDLHNEVPFLFISTSCLSGNFADHATGNGDNPLQDGEDSATEELVKNPDGGAVAAVANTLIGLGPVGGVQFNHALCRSIFTEGNFILGDAMLNARRTFFAEVAYFDVGNLHVEFPMNHPLFPGTEWYTQRSVLLLGDPTLRIWTTTPQALEIKGAATFSMGHNVITAQVLQGGEPVSGIGVTLHQPGGMLIRNLADADGYVEFNVDLDSDEPMVMTAYAPDKVPAVATLEYAN